MGNAVLSQSLSSHVHLFVWLHLNGCCLSLWASSLLLPHCVTWYDAWFILWDLLDFTGNSHMVRCTYRTGWKTSHGREARGVCVLWLVCPGTYTFCLLYCMYVERNLSESVQRASSILPSWTVFIKILICIHGFHGCILLCHCSKHSECVWLNGVNPLSRQH